MSSVLVETHEKIMVVTLNRPEARNAWDNSLAEGLHAAWVEFAASDALVCVVKGAGKHFSAGIDLKNPPTEGFRAQPNLSVPCNKPIIVAVEGACLGVACSFTLLADIVIADESAYFAYLEAKIGIFHGLMGGFPGRLSYKAGLQWILTGERMPAARACEIGMVSEVVGQGKAFERAMEVARQIAQNAPLVVQAMKSLALGTLTKGPVEQNFIQQQLLQLVAASDDAKEGIRAFGEKRQPRFSGQ
ncbi:MAG: enoyl-CoA hydratase-related protein [Pseudomonadota bacterium]